MFLNQIMSVFKPKNNKFHDLFIANTQNMIEASEVLVQLFNAKDETERNSYVDRIKTIETAGDNVTHEIFKELSKNFITPFDREDIHLLASSLDDVLDYINGTAQRIRITNVMEFSLAMKGLASLILEGSKNVHAAVLELKELKYSKITPLLVKIHSVENQADQAYDMSISELYHNETNALKVIKSQNILDLLENATDKCEDVANVIESIALKYS